MRSAIAQIELKISYLQRNVRTFEKKQKEPKETTPTLASADRYEPNFLHVLKLIYT